MDVPLYTHRYSRCKNCFRIHLISKLCNTGESHSEAIKGD